MSKSAMKFSEEQIEYIKKGFKIYSIPGSITDDADRFNLYLSWYMSWIFALNKISDEGLDTCPKCNLDSYKTLGGCPCEHCGLVGQRPWGG